MTEVPFRPGVLCHTTQPLSLITFYPVPILKNKLFCWKKTNAHNCFINLLSLYLQVLVIVC